METEESRGVKASILKLCVSPQSPLREAIACINESDSKIALVIDKDQRLTDTITDGDVRRAILAGLNLDMPVRDVQSQKKISQHPKPVTAIVGTHPVELLSLMESSGIRQIPLLDKTGRLVDLVTLQDLDPAVSTPLKAVVMAGGLGNRLRPLTEEVPKSMLPVGDRPILERIIQQLGEAGIHQVNLTTHYKSELITEHFGDGRKFGVDIHYVNEDQPLGTAGILKMFEESDEPMLVMNGDILTQVNFRSLHEFHKDHHADMTVAVSQHEIHIPFGVIETEGVIVKKILEKPSFKHFINAGIYLINPKVCRLIPKEQFFDMTDLIEHVMQNNGRVITFPLHEYWLDIGRYSDYEKAQEDVKNGKF